jgi:XTP/dITP diphosphohydrolase
MVSHSIYFVTSNPNKLKVANLVLRPEIDVIGYELDLPEIQTLAQNAIATDKARRAFALIKKPLFIDDSGIFIEKYHQFPGTLTKFIVKGIGLAGVIKLIEPNEPAYFRTVIVYKDATQEFLVDGIVKGSLSTKLPEYINPHMPFSGIFKRSPELNPPIKDIGETAEKISSHRHRALARMKQHLIAH